MLFDVIASLIKDDGECRQSVFIGHNAIYRKSYRMSGMPVGDFIACVAVHGQKPAAVIQFPIGFLMSVGRGDSVVHGSITDANITDIDLVLYVDDFISRAYQVKPSALIVDPTLAHVTGKEKTLMKVWVRMRFKKSDPGWILNNLNSVHDAIFRSIFFIFVGAK